MIADIDQKKNASAWKNLYSEIAQATARVSLDNSGSMAQVCNSWDDNCLRDKYLKYLNVQKKCDETANSGICWHANDNSSSMLDGEGINWWSSSSGVILTKGSLLNFNYSSQTCESKYGSLNTCGFILVDVNGFAKPNVLGKDIFQVWILENALKPRGSLDDGYGNTCTPNSSGWSCAEEYLRL